MGDAGGQDRSLTLVAGLVARLVDVAVLCGVDRTALLAELGLDASALEDRDNRLPMETFARGWKLLSESCPGRPLALDWVRSWKITDVGVMGYVFAQLSTVEEAMEAAVRYGRLIDQGEAPRLVKGGATSRLEWGLAPALLATEHLPETIMASLVHFLRGTVGESFVPIAVRLPHRSTARTDALARYYGCPVIHEAGEVSAEFPTELLGRKLPGADPVLAAYLRKQADALMEQLGSTRALSQECARRIAERLGTGEPAQKDVARRMGMSERTLQRRLQSEGTSFHELLEESRRTIACSYLSDRKLAAYEVSFLLGYAEPSTFFRAFKRWTGKTPQEYRASL